MDVSHNQMLMLKRVDKCMLGSRIFAEAPLIKWSKLTSPMIS